MPVTEHTDGPVDDEVLHELAEHGLRHYIAQTANAVGVGPEAAWCEWADAPSAYIALDRRLPGLFDTALKTACEHAGLVDEHGTALITSHRFRHTVGTQLAEEGARLQTIMSVLGHRSSTMSRLIYARITDTTVLRDYKNALTPGAHIAGPAAEALRNNELPQRSLDWLTSNYYKTALELGHCLRLPEEGPCECDLFLTCSKFLTTTDYAPRLKERLFLERKLAHDALQHGWSREAERHGATANRINQLLDELGPT
jgi:integrase-like protein/uncharacterized protein DUF6292